MRGPQPHGKGLIHSCLPITGQGIKEILGVPMTENYECLSLLAFSTSDIRYVVVVCVGAREGVSRTWRAKTDGGVSLHLAASADTWGGVTRTHLRCLLPPALAPIPGEPGWTPAASADPRAAPRRLTRPAVQTRIARVREQGTVRSRAACEGERSTNE